MSRLGGALQVNSYTEVSFCISDVALTCLSDRIFPCRVSTPRLSMDVPKEVASPCTTVQWPAMAAVFQSGVREWIRSLNVMDTTALAATTSPTYLSLLLVVGRQKCIIPHLVSLIYLSFGSHDVIR